jgi:hypothetical protein
MREMLTLAGQGGLYADYMNLQWVRLLDLLQMNLNITIPMDSLC